MKISINECSAEFFPLNSRPTVEEAHRKLDKKHVAHNPQMGDAEKSLTPTHLWGQLPIKIKCEYTDFFYAMVLTHTDSYLIC